MGGRGALMASGIGKLRPGGARCADRPAPDRPRFRSTTTAFELSGQTNQADLPDQLKLFATKLAFPGWDPNPVNRAKTAHAGQLCRPVGLARRSAVARSRGAAPFERSALGHAAHAPRWRRRRPNQFRKLWEPLLASGPIEVDVFGDMESESDDQGRGRDVGRAQAAHRPAHRAAAAVKFPAHVDKPVVRTHTGTPNQAAAVIAWPTGGGSAGITESRKLEILAAVFRDRLIDQLRSQAGSAIRRTSTAPGRSA
jgi:zinc protease